MRDSEIAHASGAGGAGSGSGAAHEAEVLLHLALPRTRREAAAELARLLGADGLLLFLRDPEIDVLLPAPGLAQTLPDGRGWQALLGRCMEAGEAEGRVRTGAAEAGGVETSGAAEAGGIEASGGVEAWGVACGPDACVVLLGGEPRRHAVRALVPQLRVVGMAVRGEQLARVARAHEGVAREMTGQAEALAQSLDRARVQAESAYEEAAHANRAKEDFLAVVSHELRTPLNAILGYGDLLEAEIAGTLTAGQKTQLGRIKMGARHLLRLIEEILTFSRVQAGAEPRHPEEVDAAALVGDTAALVEPLARAQGLGFEVQVPDDPLWMTTDPGKLGQIVLNLLSNAIKFTSAGEVRVEAARAGAEVTIAVTDSGPGIPAEYHEQIFDPFRQVQDVHTRSTGGTGLGLSVSRQLAVLLGGDLTVRSAPGEGSTFTLRLPLHEQTSNKP